MKKFLLAVIVLAIIGTGAYYYFCDKDVKNVSIETQSQPKLKNPDSLKNHSRSIYC